MSLLLASLHIYPIKSLGGFAVAQARITDRGFEHDRRWMLVDANGLFLSQRELPQMACLHCSPTDDGIRVTDVRNGDAIDLPWSLDQGKFSTVQVWNDPLPAIHAPMEISAWFSDMLEHTVSLVYMPDSSHRMIDTRYANGLTALNDGFPYLIVSQASLDDLNARMEDPLPMERFRPNMVIAGGTAFQEDDWKKISIGDARFALVKPCGRCAITTTDQRTGERGKEPLRTLGTFRRRKGDDGDVKVDFAMNAVALSGSMVRVNDTVSASLLP